MANQTPTSASSDGSFSHFDLDAVVSLLDELIASTERDIDKFGLRNRSFYVARMMFFTSIAIVYVLMAAMFFFRSRPLTFDRLDSASIFVASVGIIFVILAQFYLLKSRRSVQAIHRRLEAKIDFAHSMLTRITSWEKKFKGSYYQKSILKLKLTTLANMIDEMQEIAREGLGIFPFIGGPSR